MKEQAGENMAPDMGRLLLSVPREDIVLLSWTVTEYDGLGFVKTEHPGEKGEEGLVSLYFPRERRPYVLELIQALKSEGRSIRLLREEAPKEAARPPARADNPEEQEQP